MNINHHSHPLWTVLIGFIIVLSLGLLLAFNYNHFDPPRDLVTMIGVGATYFVSQITINMFNRNKQKEEPKDG